MFKRTLLQTTVNHQPVELWPRYISQWNATPVNHPKTTNNVTVSKKYPESLHRTSPWIFPVLPVAKSHQGDAFRVPSASTYRPILQSVCTHTMEIFHTLSSATAPERTWC